MDKLSQELLDKDRRIRVNNDTEVLRIQRSVVRTVLVILDRIKLVDKRLSLTLRKVGSYFDGLKVGLPDEFDFLAEMKELKEGEDIVVRPTGFKGTRNLWRTPPGRPGRRKIQYVGKTLHDIAEQDETDAWMKQVGTKENPEYVINCISVKNTFFDAVLKVVRAFTQEDLPRYLTVGKEPTFIHGPAVTLEFIWNGRMYKNVAISVDLTICFKVDNWKTCFDVFDWILKDSCISKTLRKALDTDGYHLTPYISDRGHSCQWRVSTSYTEHLLLSSFDHDSKVKIAIRCLKHDRDQHIAGVNDLTKMRDEECKSFFSLMRCYEGAYEEEQLVTSYMIKTAALVTLGLLPRKWFDKISLSILYKHLLFRLYASIKYDTVIMFFISDYKLRTPEFVETLPGFKSLIESTIDYEDGVNDYLISTLPNREQYDEEELDIINTHEKFHQLKRDVRMCFKYWWGSIHAP